MNLLVKANSMTDRVQVRQQHRQLFAVALTLLVFLLADGRAWAKLPIAVDGQGLPSLAPMLEGVTPGVVNISTSSRASRNKSLDELYQYFYGVEPPRQSNSEPQSLGSGVIVDASRGLVVTNNHVIEGADKVIVTLRDGREINAEVVGTDPRADIALLRIKASGLTALSWADSDSLRVGDFCVAIGNPFGLGQTVTSGIVSALRRSGLGIEDFEDFIQTDASINPGNSGGALVNLRGELIGINTAIVGPSGGNVGIGFAIPSNMAQGIIEQLLQYGEVRRGRLGISAAAITAELVREFSLTRNRGVLIVDVEKNSPAENAGLRLGDIITSIDGLRVRTVESVINRLGLIRIGETIDLQVVRGDREFSVAASVAQSITTAAGSSVASSASSSIGLLRGVQLQNRETSSGRKFVSISGLDRNSLLSQRGLQAGDIILSVDRQPVETEEDLQRVLGSDARQALLYIQRGTDTSYVQIR